MEQVRPDASQKQQRKVSQKLLTIVLLITLPIIGFFLGSIYGKNENTPDPNETKISSLNKQIAQKEEEIQLLLNDSAKTGDTAKSPYSFQNLGVYSPLFTGKEVTSTAYTYKRQTITERNLTLEEDSEKNSVAGVTIWEYTKWSNNSDQPYVIFGGYENYGNHPTVIDIDPKDKESFTNSNDIKMYWGYQYCPKSICTVTLSFFSKYTPGGHPIYVQLWANNPSYLMDSSAASAGINQAKEKLKKIADTVEDSSTYH